MSEQKKQFTIGSIIIPLIVAAIGLIPFFYDSSSTPPNTQNASSISEEKEKLALISYEEGMDLYNKGLFEEAKISLKAAINQGRIIDAYYPLARCYKEARVKDYEKYRFYCEQGVEKGDLKCHYGLWDYYALISNTKDEFKANKHADKAFEEIKKSAESGNPFWEGKLGNLYDIYKKDYEKAAYWYQKAAEQNNTNAQANLGILYQSGEGVTQDYEKAAYWYQ